MVRSARFHTNHIGGIPSRSRENGVVTRTGPSAGATVCSKQRQDMGTSGHDVCIAWHRLLYKTFLRLLVPPSTSGPTLTRQLNCLNWFDVGGALRPM